MNPTRIFFLQLIIFFLYNHGFCADSSSTIINQKPLFIKAGLTTESYTENNVFGNMYLSGISATTLRTVSGVISLEYQPFPKLPTHVIGLRVAIAGYSYYDFGAGTINEKVSEDKAIATLFYVSSYHLFKIVERVNIDIGPLVEVSYRSNTRIIGVLSNKTRLMFAPHFNPEISLRILDNFSLYATVPIGIGIGLFHQTNQYDDQYGWGALLSSGICTELRLDSKKRSYRLLYTLRETMALGSLVEGISSIHSIQFGTSIPICFKLK